MAMKKRVIQREVCLFFLVIALAHYVLAASTQVSTPSDKLDIAETFGSVVQSFTENELPDLAGGTLSTSLGKTDYTQYLSFAGLTRPQVKFADDQDGVVADFVFIDDGTVSTDAFFEYRLEFEDGLQSSISGTTLSDLPGKKVKIFNEEYTIVSATTDGSKAVLDFATGAASDLFEVGQEKEFTIAGKTYAVTLDIVDTARLEATISIDGTQLSNALAIGETYALEGGIIMGVSKILVGGAGENFADIFIGAKVIRFEDSNYQDTNFEQMVEVNKEKINKGYVKIEAAKSGTELSVNKITYRMASVEEVYIGTNEKLRDHLPENSKKGLLGNWDMVYEGLSTTSIEKISFIPTGDGKEYKISFKNVNGNTFTSIPFVVNTGTITLGDSSDVLVIKESTSIEKNDYFVITNSNTHSGLTYVMRYAGLNTETKTITFHDYSTGNDKSFSYVNGSYSGILGTGTIAVGSLSAAFNITTAANNPIKVDLSTDGTIDDDVVSIVTMGGGVLATTVPSGSTYGLTLRTAAGKFEENGTDETVAFTLETRSTGLGIQSTFTGITTESVSGGTQGLSNYGVYMVYTDPGGTEAETLTFDYPQAQKFGVVTIIVNAPEVVASAVVEEEVGLTCDNGIQDGEETDIDCGGPCSACDVPASESESCADGVQNQDETEIDCGGSCLPCTIDSQCPQACFYTNQDSLEVCLQVGDRINDIYCNRDLKITLQKSNGLACEQAYECQINICEEQICGKHITPALVLVNIVLVLALAALLYLILEAAITKT